ncbi:MAG TPA: hypothetical protein VD969_16060 [Symbiobacteriaceae bacterium]|nr:hypothetical protein [Symbiobacteriaceae bacterium]
MTRSIRAEELLDLMETLLQAQLETIQEIRRVRLSGDDVEFLGRTPARKGVSHVDMVHEVLVAADGPLHIGEITKRVRTAYGIFVTRESLASVATREARTGGRLVKTGPNTYDIAGRVQP